MLYRLLGPLEVTDDDRAVELGEGRQRVVLVLLLLHRNEPLSSDRIIDALWGEAPPPTAGKVLQNYVGRLRRALGDREGRRLQTHGHGYALRVDEGELDVDRFERLLREGGDALEDDRPADAAGLLREALGLWRGPAIADVAYEAFAQPEIARLEEQRTVALERRIDADLALGRHADLVAELETLVARNPLREHPRGQRMLALYRCGRQAEALEAFREARRLLVAEVGLEPGVELRRLHEAILRQDPALELAPADLPAELDPAELPTLVGRGRELEWLRERWERARDGCGALVAVTGEVGMGKTRLAAELAGEVHRAHSSVLYVAGAAGRDAVATAVRRARKARHPTLLVVDDADATDGALDALDDLARAIATTSLLALATGAAGNGLGHVAAPHDSMALDPLDAEAVRRIALLYASDGENSPVPCDELLEASRGVPRRVHDVASAWARSEARRRVTALAPIAAAGRSDLRTAEAALVGGVVDLEAARRRVERLAAREAPVVCPFKGLASFEAADAGYFFGRERLVAELIARVVGAPLLGVVGPSGSGKSSVIRAGLLPALADGVLPGSHEWPQHVLRPGEHPMHELRDAGCATRARNRVVLVVDQFEEVFTACRDERERAAFIDALVRRGPARDGDDLVVLAIRADFYGRCATYPALSRLLGANHVLVGPMQRDELRRAIELPAERAGLDAEPALVDDLLADVEDEPGGLPLLSTALLELWQHRDGHALRHATYELTGGVRGAVGRLAEDAFGRLGPGQQTVARTLLLRLAGEGASGAIVRRRVALSELESPNDEDLDRVLALFTERRLLTMSATTVEVAHEALLREWPRLRGWLDEDAQGRRTHRRLTDAARDWDERGRDAGDLYRGARLAVALEWRGTHQHELNSTERAFVETSRVAAGRAQRRLRLALAGVAALLAVAVLGAVVALQQRSAARTEAQRAEAQRIGVQALAEPDLARSLLLARQGFALADNQVTRSNLLDVLMRRPTAVKVFHGEGTPRTAIDLAPDGRTLVIGDRQGTVELVDPLTRRRIGPRYKAGNAITTVRFSADATRVAVAGYGIAEEGFIALLDVARRRVLQLSITDVAKYIANVGNVAFSPDSRVVTADFVPFPQVSSALRRYVVRWDARTGLALGPARPVGRVRAASLGMATPPELGGFVARGSRLVTSSTVEHSTVIRDIGRGLRSVRRLPGGGIPADVSADGRLLALTDRDGSARVLDLRTGVARPLLARPRSPVTAMRFTADSRRLVTVDRSGRLTTWDARRAIPRGTVAEVTGRVQDIAISANGSTVYSAGRDGSVIEWDAAGVRGLRVPFRAGPRGTDLAAPSGGATFVVANGSASVEILDGRTLRHKGRIAVAPAAAREPGATGVAISPEGDTLAAAMADGAVSFADLRTGRALGPPVTAHVRPIMALAFSPDGRWLVTGARDSALYAWDVRRRTTVGLYVALTRPVTSLSVSPDGTKVAATVVHEDGTGELNVLRLPRLTLVTHVSAMAGTQTQFSRDGRRLLYGDDAGRVWTLDTRTWRPLGRPVRGPARPGRFALSPDERVLATTSRDGTTQLWDVASGRTIGSALPGRAGGARRAVFVDGGAGLVTLGESGDGSRWDVRPDSWGRRACATAGRPLTRAEWRDVLPARDYAPACTRAKGPG